MVHNNLALEGFLLRKSFLLRKIICFKVAIGKQLVLFQGAYSKYMVSNNSSLSSNIEVDIFSDSLYIILSDFGIAFFLS